MREFIPSKIPNGEKKPKERQMSPRSTPRRLFVLVLVSVTLALCFLTFSGGVTAQEVDDSAIYVGFDNGTVEAIDSDGERLWMNSIHENRVLEVQYDEIDNVLYSISTDDNITSINPNTGDVNWVVTDNITHSGDSFFADYYINRDYDDGFLYYPSENEIKRLDINTQEIDSSFNISSYDDGDIISLALMPDEDILVYTSDLEGASASENDEAVAHDTSTQNEIWRTDVSTSEQFRDPKVVKKGINGDYFALGSDWGYLHYINHTTGEEVYRGEGGGNVGGIQEVPNTNITYYTENILTSAISIDVNRSREYQGYEESPFGSEQITQLGVLPDESMILAGPGGTILRTEGWPNLPENSIWIENYGSGIHAVDTNIEITDIPEPDAEPQLSIESREFIELNKSIKYTVRSNVSGDWEDVTNDASVTSDNASILTVDSSNMTFEGVGIGKVNVTAEYNGMETSKEMTVSPLEVEYLDILPPVYRFTTFISDTTIMVILIATGFAAAATRAASAFAGLGAMELILIIGWFGDFVSLGIVLVGLFTAIFIGFNLAANIDYTVRR